MPTRITRNQSTARTAALTLASLLASLPGLNTAGPADAEPDAGAARTSPEADQLRQIVSQLTVRDGEGRPAEALQPRAEPLLTYSDPARGYLAAGVWRLGTTGRPLGLFSAEYWAGANGPQALPQVACELVAISVQPFQLAGGGMHWQSAGHDSDWTVLTETPAPADSPRQRLTQMRAIMRRMTAREVYRGDFNALRLLSQPIDRYQENERAVTDGAVFLFAYGTNPEIAVVLECADEKWRCLPLRMTWAESIVELDGREIARFPEIKAHPTDGPYQTSMRPAAPDVAAP